MDRVEITGPAAAGRENAAAAPPRPPYPSRFVSFAEFESLEAIEEFRSRPDFDELVGAMREHLDDLKISTLEQVIAP